MARRRRSVAAFSTDRGALPGKLDFALGRSGHGSGRPVDGSAACGSAGAPPDPPGAFHLALGAPSAAGGVDAGAAGAAAPAAAPSRFEEPSSLGARPGRRRWSGHVGHTTPLPAHFARLLEGCGAGHFSPLDQKQHVLGKRRLLHCACRRRLQFLQWMRRLSAEALRHFQVVFLVRPWQRGCEGCRRVPMPGCSPDRPRFHPPDRGKGRRAQPAAGVAVDRGQAVS